VLGCCNGIYASHPGDEAIKTWLAYFSAYGIKSGGAIQYHCGAYFDGRWLLDAPVKPAHDDGEVYQFEREPL
jgi:hypothetical protein